MELLYSQMMKNIFAHFFKNSLGDNWTISYPQIILKE